MTKSRAHTISEAFSGFFREKNISTASVFLVAVSGGIDSAVLCNLCRQAGFRFSIAHCNFRLRGEESDRDEGFVKSLGAALDVEVLVKNFDTIAYADQNKLSIQEAARRLRYDWFAELKKEKNFSFILLAHQADDDLETLLMHFFRGTGLQGLTGIPEWNKDAGLLRPLLRVRRQEIREYALVHQLQWVEDSSNASSKYTRNFFRNELLPAIKNVYPQVEENLLASILRFKSINQLFKQSVSELKQKLVEHQGREARIAVRKLLAYPPALIYEIISDYGFGEKQVDEVLALAEAPSGKYIANEQYQIIKHRNWLIIALREENASTIVIEKGMKEIKFSGGFLEISIQCKEKFQLQKKDNLAQLDLHDIEFPLLLRKWKQGDYFYPFGMRKKKKLSRFFIDQKLPKNQKENIWVLESNKRIIWVVGLRIDDRFKITDSTKEMVRLEFVR